jgi:hypothetical protein
MKIMEDNFFFEHVTDLVAIVPEYFDESIVE